MRAWSVSAFFPEVKPAHEAMQSCTVNAGKIHVAMHRGLRQILGRDAIKRKHISIMKLSIVEAGKQKESKER